MITEEKAKHYDELLDKAKQIYNKENDVLIMHTIEDLFPQLKESEDERIRESLLEYLHTLPNHYAHSGVCTPEWIAWLEKQGEQILANSAKTCKVEQKSFDYENANIQQKDYAEQKPTQTDVEKEYVRTLKSLISDFLRDNKNVDRNYYQEIWDWLEGRHVEQKPADLPKGEDYGIDSLYHAQRILEKTLGKVDGYQTDDGILSHKCAISAVKKLYEQKPAWNEEDDDVLEDVEEAIINYWHGQSQEDILDWLKSLKDRVQPKQEWNEQEQVRINRIVNFLENLNVADNDILLKDVDWLKSLRLQSQWKPSDEQMEALKNAIHLKPFENPSDNLLWGLYEQLRILKGY